MLARKTYTSMNLYLHELNLETSSWEIAETNPIRITQEDVFENRQATGEREVCLGSKVG